MLLALASQHFGWTTTAGNSLYVWSQDGQWMVTFESRRHALLETGNGVGAVFSALGGREWAKDAYVQAFASTTPEREWYETASHVNA